MAYVLDNLVKYHCFGCDKEFILSEYQVENATKKLICPYCHSYDVEDTVLMDDKEGLEDLGCMAIGHYTDANEEAYFMDNIWRKIKEQRRSLLNK